MDDLREELKEALRELEDLRHRANKITSLDDFKEKLSGIKIPTRIKTTMIDICRKACPIPSPVPGLIVFHVKETLDWAIDEIKQRI